MASTAPRNYPTSIPESFPVTNRRKYPTPPPPPRSNPLSFTYDVFLSFRGKDTRNNFTGHLYHRLVEAGIRTFMDDLELPKGGVIAQQLMRAIEESRTYIVVFSPNYVASRWCLDELVNILSQCDRKRGRVLLPVFYGVQPSDVRRQKGIFEEDIRHHYTKYINEPHLVDMWRHALFRAANYSGFDLQSSALGSESRLISLIIKEVVSLVKPKKLFVAKYPVGLDSRVNDVYSLLRPESNYHVQYIGILGMGGSGKSVIAKALYNKILQSFDSSCFLANVREDSQQPNGLVHLQEKLISRLMMRKNVKVDIVDEGIEIIKERLCYKKVLIVLDDTDKLSQVNALAGRDWFGPGSVVIITTRDLHLLTQLQVDERYEVKDLNYNESMELFCWHSFQKEFPEEPYAVIADKIVAYSSGLPIALVVLGTYLCGRTVKEWKSAFEMLRKIPHNEIQQILKISYDGLDNDEQRDIFLDIACFFIGEDIDYVTEILNGCDFSTEIGIGILKDRCLLTVDGNNELRMHDLLRDMGREIIRQPFPKEPGKRSRLWSHQDVIDVLVRNTGTAAIEGVTLVSPIEEEIHLNTRNFTRMHDLRLLQMERVILDGSLEHLSGKLRWVRWQDCSLEHLPSDFHVQNVVALDMQHSRMTKVWQGAQVLRHLKILNLSHSKRLTSTPDFTSVPSLVTLILVGCTSLLHIHPSIGCLDSLLVLNMEGCEKITNVPSEICSLRLLGYLNLSGCSNLQALPYELGSIESLRELSAEKTAITLLPLSLANHRNLTSLSLRGCTKMTRGNAFPINVYRSCILPSKGALRRLNLRECNLCDEDIPYNIGDLSGLQELDLAGNSLSKLPYSFKELTNLESLWLDNWSILQSVSGLPSNLKALVPKLIITSKGDLPNPPDSGRDST